MSRPIVLVLSQRIDPHVDFIIERLATREVEVIRFDTADFPRRATLRALAGADAAWSGTLVADGRTIDLQEIRSIWYRRPQEFDLDEGLTASEKKFAHGESLMAIGGLLRATNALWVNHPEKNTSASYKPYQLAVAAAHGLQVPRTLITNEPAAVREFFDSCSGEVIYKTMSTPMSFNDEIPWSIYTTQVTGGDLEQLDRVRRAPCLFQERVSRDRELRIVAIGSELFAAEIHAPPDILDWRTDYPRLTYARHDLPPEIATKLLCVLRALNLQFAAIDMIVSPDGRYVFLELNPAGQWAWLELRTRMPMAQALTDLLVSGARQPVFA